MKHDANEALTILIERVDLKSKKDCNKMKVNGFHDIDKGTEVMR